MGGGGSDLTGKQCRYFHPLMLAAQMANIVQAALGNTLPARISTLFARFAPIVTFIVTARSLSSQNNKQPDLLVTRRRS